MSPTHPEPSRGEVLVYEASGGGVRVDVRLEQETVWLSQQQMAELFARERSVISKHLRNIFKDKELDPDSGCAIFAQTAADGKTYQVEAFNLDAILSVGYGVTRSVARSSASGPPGRSGTTFFAAAASMRGGWPSEASRICSRPSAS